MSRIWLRNCANVFGVVMFVVLAYASILDADDLVPFRNGNKWGVADISGNIVIPCEYDSILPFKNDKALVQLPSKKSGFISKPDLSLFTLPEYSFCRQFSESMAACQKSGKWGFIDKNLNNVIKCQYSEVGDFYEGHAKVKKNGKYGYITKTGKVVIPLQFDAADNFSEGLAAVRLKDKKGYIDTYGKTIVPFNFDDAQRFSESVAPVSKGKLWGYINKSGEVIIEPQYLWGRPFSDGLAIVTDSKNRFGAIDIHGTFIIPSGNFEFLGDFSDGIAPAGKYVDKFTILYGFIDKTGKMIIPFKYLYASNFQNNLARVYTATNDKILELNGKMVTSSEYINGGYIDRSGKEFWHDKSTSWLSVFLIILILIFGGLGYVIHRFVRHQKNRC